jgi:hypothetical protein
MADADLARRRLWRRFTDDARVRSDLARRLMDYLVDEWERRGAMVVVLGFYARKLETDTTNVGRALDRLVLYGWLVLGPREGPGHSIRLRVGPGPEWLRAVDESRGRESA